MHIKPASEHIRCALCWRVFCLLRICIPLVIWAGLFGQPQPRCFIQEPAELRDRGVRQDGFGYQHARVPSRRISREARRACCVLQREAKPATGRALLSGNIG